MIWLIIFSVFFTIYFLRVAPAKDTGMLTHFGGSELQSFCKAMFFATLFGLGFSLISDFIIPKQWALRNWFTLYLLR